MFNFLKKLLGGKQPPATQQQNNEPEQMKFLVVGLGNIGAEYQGTRHNIGFTVVEALADQAGATWATARYGAVAEIMNLSGEAVRYWAQKEKIGLDHILVVVDDIALPFGAIRMRGKGADGGHNGLKNIDQMLGSQQYARLRFGVGNDFPRGAQVDYVLSHPGADELAVLPERAKVACDAIRAFCLSGIDFAMTHFNNK